MAKSKDGQNKKKMKISTVLIFFFCSRIYNVSSLCVDGQRFL